VEALTATQAQARIVILSNGDPDMLEGHQARLGIEFDRIISVAEAQLQADAAILQGREIWPASPERSWFVATMRSTAWAPRPTAMRTAFIDRPQAALGNWPYQPDIVVADLKSLADALE